MLWLYASPKHEQLYYLQCVCWCYKHRTQLFSNEKKKHLSFILFRFSSQIGFCVPSLFPVLLLNGSKRNLSLSFTTRACTFHVRFFTTITTFLSLSASFAICIELSRFFFLYSLRSFFPKIRKILERGH